MEIKKLRILLKPYVHAPSKLSAQDTLLRAAALRVIAPCDFSRIKAENLASARQARTKDTWRVLAWPVHEEDRKDAAAKKKEDAARPDFVERRITNKTMRQTTSKMKLGTFCNDAEVASLLRQAAEDMAQITFEATRLLNAYVLQQVEDDIPLNFDKPNIIRHAMCLVSSTRQSSGIAIDADLQRAFDVLYYPSRPDDLVIPSRNNRGNILTIASQQLHRNLKLHVGGQFGRRLYKWICLAVARASPAAPPHQVCSRLTGEHLHTVASAVMDALLSPSAELDAANSHLEEAERAQLKAWFEGVKIAFQDVFPLNKTVKWWQLFPVMRKMCEDACVQRAAYVQANHPIPRSLLKPFAMTPLCDFTTPHIGLDTVALAEVVKGLRGYHASGTGSDNDSLWRRWFNVPDVETKVRKFGNYISTDGVAVSLRLVFEGAEASLDRDDAVCAKTSKQADKDLASETSKLDAEARTKELPDIHDISKCRVFAIDPGIRSPISGVAYNPDHPTAKSKGMGISSAEWRTSCGFKAADKKRCTWLSQREDVQTFLESMPSAKVATTEAYITYLTYTLPGLTQLKKFYGAVRCRNARFKSYGKRLKTMDDVVGRIAPKGTTTVIPFGAAGFGHSLRGNASSPYGKIRKALEQRKGCHVVRIGECNTSATCSKCTEKLKDVKGERFIGGAMRKVNAYGVKVCNHCLTTWDRDLNAARNILAIFLALRAGAQRPAVFRPRQHR